ncbi:MAG: triphosphoribosyl-dephospho-CoA synthase [Promethearchaeota archaeon]
MSIGEKLEQQLWDISEKGQFALLLDIITPKPGNVHRYRDHPDTRLIHFAASIAYLGYPLYLSARWSHNQTINSLRESRLGELIKIAVQKSMAPHEKNTLLGTIMIFVPLAAAAGSSISQSKLTVSVLRQQLKRILEETTVEDAVKLIQALQIAAPGGSIPKTPDWTPKSKAFNFQSPHTINLIRREHYTLRDLQSLASTYDAIAHEYVTNFSFIFETLYPLLTNTLNRYHRIEDAILATYVASLAQRPDSLIRRKAGSQVAEEVVDRAKKLYDKITQLPPKRWTDDIQAFDDYLRSQGSMLNPGTTADLLSGAVFLALLLENIRLIY